MLIALIVLLVAVLIAARGGRDAQPIIHRPYNNRYNDASGAREDHHL